MSIKMKKKYFDEKILVSKILILDSSFSEFCEINRIIPLIN